MLGKWLFRSFLEPLRWKLTQNYLKRGPIEAAFLWSIQRSVLTEKAWLGTVARLDDLRESQQPLCSAATCKQLSGCPALQGLLNTLWGCVDSSGVTTPWTHLETPKTMRMVETWCVPASQLVSQPEYVARLKGWKTKVKVPLGLTREKDYCLLLFLSLKIPILDDNTWSRLCSGPFHSGQ